MAKKNIAEVKGLNLVMICTLNLIFPCHSILRSLQQTAFDCIDCLKARLKIYARSYDLTFSNFKEIYTLGGQIGTPFLLTSSFQADFREKHTSQEEASAFQAFYDALFDLPEDWDGVTEHVERKNLRHAGVLWQFELMHGKRVIHFRLLQSQYLKFTTSSCRKLSSTYPSGTSFPMTPRLLEDSNDSSALNRGS